MVWINVAPDRQVSSCCEHGDEPSVSIKCGKISWLAAECLGPQVEICSKELSCIAT